VKIFIVTIALLIAFAVAGFAMLNAQVVPLNYFLGVVELPLVALALLAIVFGVLLSSTLLIPALIRRNLQCRRLQAQLSKLEARVKESENRV
jgi:uncharacterized integral membrane protein